MNKEKTNKRGRKPLDKNLVLEINKMFINGYSKSRIAEKLRISLKTVKKYTKCLCNQSVNCETQKVSISIPKLSILCYNVINKHLKEQNEQIRILKAKINSSKITEIAINNKYSISDLPVEMLFLVCENLTIIDCYQLSISNKLMKNLLAGLYQTYILAKSIIIRYGGKLKLKKNIYNNPFKYDEIVNMVIQEWELSIQLENFINPFSKRQITRGGYIFCYIDALYAYCKDIALYKKNPLLAVQNLKAPVFRSNLSIVLEVIRDKNFTKNLINDTDLFDLIKNNGYFIDIYNMQIREKLKNAKWLAEEYKELHKYLSNNFRGNERLIVLDKESHESSN